MKGLVFRMTPSVPRVLEIPVSFFANSGDLNVLFTNSVSTGREREREREDGAAGENRAVVDNYFPNCPRRRPPTISPPSPSTTTAPPPPPSFPSSSTSSDIAVDCTRFAVLRGPGGDPEEADSIVAQIVADSSCKILSIATGFSGDKGDAMVLRSSTLYKDAEEGVLLNLPPIFLRGVAVRPYLIGDGGYPLLPWLMVPYVDPVPASCEEDINKAHYRMRLPALRTLASLRNWGILSRPIDEEVRMSVACVGACVILHNVLLTREDNSALTDGVEDYAVHDQSSQYYRDASLEECLIEKKASIMRNALAAKAREAKVGR